MPLASLRLEVGQWAMLQAGVGEQPDFAVVEVDGMHADEAGPQLGQRLQPGEWALAVLLQAVGDFLSGFVDVAVDRQVEAVRPAWRCAGMSGRRRYRARVAPRQKLSSGLSRQAS